MIERIRRRLTLWYVGILALILVLFGAIVVTAFSSQLTHQQDDQLLQRAQDAANFVRTHGSGLAPGLPPRAGPQGPDSTNTPPEKPGLPPLGVALYSVPPKGVSVDHAKIYGRIPGSLSLPYTKAAREAEREKMVIVQTLSGPKGDVRVVSLPVTNSSGKVIAIVQAAQSRFVVDRTVEDLIFILVPVGVVSLLLAGLGGLFISRRAMRPVAESFRRQRTFVADASHELKTPLALVKTGAEIIKRNPTDPENREVVDDQLSEIDRMNALLSDLLVLARLDAGKLDVEREPFDLSVIAAETAGRFLTRARPEGIQLEIEVPESLPARGDPERTSQILTALLDNAMRYTPKGGTVTVSGRRLGNGVEASVRDTGPGIPAEHLDRIFDRFYRADESRARAGGGTGLGLAISRDLAHAQGGDLLAENVAGKGAVFRLRLPGP